MKYNKARYKASHNSYDRDEQPITEQLKWSRTHPHQAGCRGLELDLVQSPNGWSWSVSHGGAYSSERAKQFAHYLRLLDEWSRRHPTHDVITVTLDLKRQHGDHALFPSRFDRYVRRYLRRKRIFAPKSVIGSYPDLVSATLAGAWPELRDLRGKFILCLSGHERRKRCYTATNPKRRLCFSDWNTKRIPKRGHRVFINRPMEVYPAHPNMWRLLLRKTAAQGFITRLYVLNQSYTWDRAQQCHACILPTDHVRDKTWARAGCRPFEDRAGHRSKNMQCG